MTVNILILFGLIFLNSFFSMAEMAIVSARKARLKQKADNGNRAARMSLETAIKPGNFLSTIQIFVTLIDTVKGAFVGAFIANDIARIFISLGMNPANAPGFAFSFVIVVSTILSVIFGELVPKNIALSKPETMAQLIIYPLRFLSILLLPLVKLLAIITDLVLAIFRIKPGSDIPVTEEEVKVLISQGTETGIFDHREKAIFEGVLYLGDRKSGSFMTPRTEMEYIDSSWPQEKQAAFILEKREYSWIPLADGGLDRIAGIVNTMEAIAAMASGNFSSPELFTEKALLVPESLSALDLFSRLRQSSRQAAIILDEYGGVSGMVCFSDLANAILDDALCPEKKPEETATHEKDGSWTIPAQIPVDELADIMGMPEEDLRGDYDTAAGFVLEKLGSIPRAGDSFFWEGWDIKILAMDGRRISKISILPPEPENPYS